jgi:membrane associated rhomboid family serine protease
MIPLKSTEPVYSAAKVTASLIAINLAVFFYQLSLPSYELNRFVEQWGIVPDRLHLETLITSMFLHGGWLHVLGNMLFLWVFGRNVEDLIGGGRFLAFYLLCGLAAALIQVVTHFYSTVPTIGASGAISGVMGAYLIKFPRARIVTLVFIVFFVTTIDIPSALFLLVWFGMQFLSLAQTDYTGGGVAWFAHVGGFVAGMLLIRAFPQKRRWRTWRGWDEE